MLRTRNLSCAHQEKLVQELIFVIRIELHDPAKLARMSSRAPGRKRPSVVICTRDYRDNRLHVVADSATMAQKDADRSLILNAILPEI